MWNIMGGAGSITLAIILFLIVGNQTRKIIIGIYLPIMSVLRTPSIHEDKHVYFEH